MCTLQLIENKDKNNLNDINLVSERLLKKGWNVLRKNKWFYGTPQGSFLNFPVT